MNEKQKKAVIREFANKVRLARFNAELTQEELAERSNIHANYLGMIERATRNPSLLVIVDIAHGLGVPVRQLLPD